MTDLLNNNENWKQTLRESIITGIVGTQQEVDMANENVGYYYSFYAPSFLYKYYSDNNERLETIESNQMWYSAPCKFNDTFDCDIAINEKELFENLLKLVPDKRGIKSGSYIWRQLKQEVHNQLTSLSDFFEETKRTTGISCFSELNDSLLMWAHYANNHRGMCVEYELLEINKQLKFSHVPVIYDNDRVSFNSFDENTIDKDATAMFIKSLTSKSPEWSYEKEWRIIRDDRSCGKKWDVKNNGALLEMICPRSIILGCMAKADFEHLVHEYCKKIKLTFIK